MTPENYRKIHASVMAWGYSVNKSGIVDIVEPIPGNVAEIDNYTNICVNGNEKLVFFLDTIEEEYMQKLNLLFGGILAFTQHVGKYQNCTIEMIQFFDIDEINKYHNLEIDTYLVAIHEFGHALGMQHIDNDKSIMYKTIGDGLTFLTQHDIDEFCFVFKCTYQERNRIGYMHIPEESIEKKEEKNK
jgi:predicted Zn-dependent protease